MNVFSNWTTEPNFFLFWLIYPPNSYALKVSPTSMTARQTSVKSGQISYMVFFVSTVPKEKNRIENNI